MLKLLARVSLSLAGTNDESVGLKFICSDVDSPYIVGVNVNVNDWKFVGIEFVKAGFDNDDEYENS